MSKTLKTYICNVREGKPGRSIPAVGVGDGGKSQHASTTSTGHACGCPWLDRGKPEASQHVRPSGHGGVSGALDGDGRRMDGKGASGASD
jgi:hypothetical protein